MKIILLASLLFASYSIQASESAKENTITQSKSEVFFTGPKKRRNKVYLC